MMMFIRGLPPMADGWHMLLTNLGVAIRGFHKHPRFLQLRPSVKALAPRLAKDGKRHIVEFRHQQRGADSSRQGAVSQIRLQRHPCRVVPLTGSQGTAYSYSH